MKIREGFVSNSSSSSYVLIGCQLSDEALAKALNIAEGVDLWEKINEFDLFWDSEEGIVGYIIAEGDDGDFGGDAISIPEVMKKANDVATKLSVPIEEIKILSGIRSC